MLAVFAERGLGDNEKKDAASKLASKMAAAWKIKAVKSAAQLEKDNTMAQLKVLRMHADFDAYGNAPPEEHRVFHELFLGHGKNGFAHLERDGCDMLDVQSSISGDIAVLFSGDLSKMRSINTINVLGTRQTDSEMVLARYTAATLVHNNFGVGSTKFSDTPLLKNELAKLKGSYAIVLYDRKWKRIIIARDDNGGEPLYWGVQNTGVGMVVSSDENVVIKECRRFCEFPKGGLYISEKGSVNTGALNGRKIIDPVKLTPPSSANPQLASAVGGGLGSARARRNTTHVDSPPREKSDVVRLRRNTTCLTSDAQLSPYSPARRHRNSCFSSETAAAKFAMKLDQEWIAEHAAELEGGSPDMPINKLESAVKSPEVSAPARTASNVT